MAVLRHAPRQATGDETAPREPSVHDQLVERAAAWLWRRAGCSVVLSEPFQAVTHTNEKPDAVGWRTGVSILMEAKASRSDFFADQRKPFRAEPLRGVGDWRFYLTPPETVFPTDLPDGWGLLWAYPKQIRAQTAMPGNSQWVRDAPFTPNQQAEREILTAALRRVAVRGHLDDVYEEK